MTTVTMPRLSAEMTEGKLLCWHVEAGAVVQPGQVIAEVETDKANMEVEALAAGRVIRLLAAPGDVVPVGAAIAELLAESGEGA